MPTYDYQCRSCGTTVEVIHGMTEDGPTACAVCGGPLRRVLYLAGIIFKGSGFYRNDARSASGGSTKPAASTSDGGSAKKTDAPASDAGSSSTAKPASDGSTSSASTSTSSD